MLIHPNIREQVPIKTALLKQNIFFGIKFRFVFCVVITILIGLAY